VGRDVAIPVTVFLGLRRWVVLELVKFGVPSDARRLRTLPRQDAQIVAFLVGDLKFIAVHFPFDSNEKIEMHAFGLEPGFQIFAGIRAELDEHFSFEHIDEDTFRAREAAGLHALGKSFGSLASEAGESVLSKIAWHRNSRYEFDFKYFTEADSRA
jgi:hypothetical protein